MTERGTMADTSKHFDETQVGCEYMRFRVSPEIFSRFPDYCVGIVVAMEVNNATVDVGDSLESSIRETRVALRADDGTNESASITLWREAFAASGIDPDEFPSSIEALVHAAVKGTGPNPINPAVDLANAVSLRYQLPIGAHDIDKLRGDFEVRVGRAGDRFAPLGKLELEDVPAGEPVYADENEVRTRRWVWRLGERGKVTKASTNVFFPIDGFTGKNDAQVRQAVQDLSELLEGKLGARTRTFFVDRTQPECTLPVPARHGPDDVDYLLGRNVVDALPREGLERRLRDGEKLRIYLGVDPTSPSIHVGNAIALRKLRHFQRLGHKVIFLIGDFTGRIGDPTDKSAVRQQLTSEQVSHNASSYVEQAGRILDINSPVNPIEVRYNGDWWDKMHAREIIELAANFTAQQMIQRDMFQKRLGENKPIGLHEFLYPLLQGYDSVVLNTDIEIGGTDQTFNMLAGRTLVAALQNREKYVMTCPLLEGTDGRKMSKSFNNAVGITDPPFEMYGRLMSLRDEMILTYFELCTDASEAELSEIGNWLQAGANPMELKKRLAFSVVEIYHERPAALEAQRRFEREIQQKQLPDEIPDAPIARLEAWSIVDLLTTTNQAESKSEARRLVQQGSVYLDSDQIKDPRATVNVNEGAVLRSRRRRFVRLVRQD